VRRHPLAPAIIVCAALLGCGGKGGNDHGGTVIPPPPPALAFACSDSPPLADQVVMQCEYQQKADVWQISVDIGYPTTSTNIAGFAFDVLIDPRVLTYVPGSAKMGNMLFQSTAAPLLVVDTLPGDPVRLVVGINLTEGAHGVQGLPSYHQIMLFSVQAVPGAEFDVEPLHLTFDKQRSQALDDSPVQAQQIDSITFSDQILLSRQ